jgi:uncharacterized protein (TIGR02391 family)
MLTVRQHNITYSRAYMKTKIHQIAYYTSGISIFAIIIVIFWIATSNNVSAEIARDFSQVIGAVFGPVMILFALFTVGISSLLIFIITKRNRPKPNLSSPLLQKHITPELIETKPQAAIEHAFTLFEDNLRRRINVGPDIYGEELINRAFGKNGTLSYGEVAGEDIGVRNLMAGAYATFRNSRKHRLTQDDEMSALSIIQLIDLMIVLTEDSKAR